MLEWHTDNRYKTYDPNQFRNEGLNRFPRWICHSPQHSLNITADGVLTTGICKAKEYGNIFDGKFTAREKTLTCPFQFCTAIPDIEAPKTSPDGRLSVRPKEPFLSINWDIGRRCNFDCSYCTPMFHNDSEDFRSFEDLKRGWFALLSFLDARRSLARKTLHILGGEPTIHPQYLEFVEFLNRESSGFRIVTLSNGSRDIAFYKRLLQGSDLTISVHFEFVKTSAMMAKISALTADSELHGRSNQIRVKVMAPPKDVQRAVDFGNELRRCSNLRADQVELLKIKDPATGLRTFLEYSQAQLEMLTFFGQNSEP